MIPQFVSIPASYSMMFGTIFETRIKKNNQKYKFMNKIKWVLLGAILLVSSQKSDANNYMGSLYKVLSLSKITKTLPDSIPLIINVRELSIGYSDTVINNIKCQFYSSKEDIFFSGNKYWLEVFECFESKEKIMVRVFFNSYDELKDREYRAATFILKNVSGQWVIRKDKIKTIKYKQIPKFEKKEERDAYKHIGPW